MTEDYTTPTSTADTLKATPVRAPFGYYGAKQRLARRIVATLPPHHAWVEGFCGSAALTLAKSPAPIEIINDRDSEIVNVFEQLRNNHEELCRQIALTPYAFDEFRAARDQQQGLTAIERARRFLILTMMTVNGTSGSGRAGFSFSQSYSRESREARVNRWYNLPDRLASVVERLRGIRVENRDAVELVRMFSDRPATLMYLDPPYFTKREHSYAIDANDRGFHEGLLSACAQAKCMLLISGYEDPLYEDLLRTEAGWVKERIETHTRDTTGRDYARAEILWMNSAFVDARRRGVVPLELTPAERKENKLNPSRK